MSRRLEVNYEKSEGKFDSQFFQCWLNIWKFEEYGPVRNTLIVKHEADAPDNRREADILGAGQVVQNNLGFSWGGHIVLRSNKNSIKDIKVQMRGFQSVYIYSRIYIIILGR